MLKAGDMIVCYARYNSRIERWFSNDSSHERKQTFMVLHARFLGGIVIGENDITDIASIDESFLVQTNVGTLIYRNKHGTIIRKAKQ